MVETSGDHGKAGPRANGRVFRWALAYDLLLRMIWLGSERIYREKTLEYAGIGTGESVLDVGCGTGTLALAAKRRVGPSGRVVGVDASPEMISRARKKAAVAALDVDFQIASSEALPFTEATFEAVLSTTVLHCLADDAREPSIREMVRVLKPNGRLLLIDFGGSAREKRSLIGHLRAHRDFDVLDLIPAFQRTGLIDLRSGPLGFSDLQFVIATRVADTSSRSE